MKKKNLFAWLAMTAMLVGTGCSTDEVVNDFSQDNAIQFGTYVGRNAVSRATVIDNQKLGTDGFGVFAYYTKDADFVAAAGEGTTASAPNFMYNEQVTNSTWNTETKTFTGPWTYSPVKYWPNNLDDKVSFFAYAPWQEKKTQNAATDNFTFNEAPGLPTIQFAVNETVKAQEDLLWAEPHLNLTKSTTYPETDDVVSFEFKHALSRIGFEVQTMIDKVNQDANGTDDDDETTATGDDSKNGKNLDSATKVVVKKVTLKGMFYKEGNLAWTLDQTSQKYQAAITGDAVTEETTFELSASNSNFKNQTEVKVPATVANGKSQYNVTGQSVNQAEAQLNADDSYIMIIPQNFPSTGEEKLTIYVEYDVVTEDPNLSDGYSLVENKITATQFNGVNFEAGKAYKFSLHLGLTTVKLAATVSDWIDANNPEKDWAVNVPLNIAPATNN